MDIGNKIKQLRMRKGLTLEELASRSELTKGFLSQLERNLTSPSIDSLSDILEALGSNLAEFFKEDKVEKRTFSAEDFFVDERETCTVHWIVPNTQKNQMEPILIELPAGGESFEMQPHNVRVTCIVPSSASTGFQSACGIGETTDLLLSEDIAETVLYVANLPQRAVVEDVTVWGIDKQVNPL